MNINELQPRQGDVDITVEIVSIDPPREFQKFGKPGKVANATIKDATGEMKLTLWNEQIDQVKKGDRVHIQKGYVNEWQGEKQLTTGKFGTMEIVESAVAQSEEKPVPSPSPEKEEETSAGDDLVEEDFEEETID